MSPAKPKQVIDHGISQKAHIPIGVNAQRAMPFRQLGTVNPMYQRNMRKNRHIPSHALIDHILPKRIVQMVVPADHMRNPHIMIVNHHSQHIGRGAISSQYHHIVEHIILYRHRALNRIFDSCRAVIGHFHTHDIGGVRWYIRAVTPRRTHSFTGFASLLTNGRKLFSAQIATIGSPALDQCICNFDMARRLRRLANRRGIAAKSKPVKPVMYRLDRIFG